MDFIVAIVILVGLFILAPNIFRRFMMHNMGFGAEGRKELLNDSHWREVEKEKIRQNKTLLEEIEKEKDC